MYAWMDRHWINASMRGWMNTLMVWVGGCIDVETMYACMDVYSL